MAVEIATIPVFEEATGSVQAQRRTTVSSRYLATIDRILVGAGDEVQRGQPLIELDDDELLAQRDEAARGVEAAEALANRRRADLGRARSLLADGIMSRSEFDEVESAARIAEAEVERRREMLSRTRIATAYATIRAPVSGRVVDRLAEPGDTATPGTPLLALYDPTALRIEVPVREKLVARLQVGTEIRVEVGNLPSLAGVVDEVVPRAELGSRTFLVKVGLPRQEGLLAGMFGRISIPSGSREQLLVPATAVETIGQLSFVQVVDDADRVRRRLVTVGRSTGGGRVEVLSGLATGEVVLDSGSGD